MPNENVDSSMTNSANGAEIAPPPQARPLTKPTRWLCDVCKIRRFDDFDAACRHEEVCNGKGDEKASASASVTPQNSLDCNDVIDMTTECGQKENKKSAEVVTMTDFFGRAAKKQTPVPAPAAKKQTTAAKKQTKSAARKQTAVSTPAMKSKPKVHDKNAVKAFTAIFSSKPVSDSISSSKNNNDKNGAKNKKGNKKSQRDLMDKKYCGDSEEFDEDCSEEECSEEECSDEDYNKNGKKRKASKAKSKCSKPTKKASKRKDQFMMITKEEKSQVDPFAAESRRKEDLERRKLESRKMDEMMRRNAGSSSSAAPSAFFLKQSKPPQKNNISSDKSSASSPAHVIDEQMERKERNAKPAPSFPVPTHILQTSSSRSSSYGKLLATSQQTLPSSSASSPASSSAPISSSTPISPSTPISSSTPISLLPDWKTASKPTSTSTSTSTLFPSPFPSKPDDYLALSVDYLKVNTDSLNDAQINVQSESDLRRHHKRSKNLSLSCEPWNSQFAPIMIPDDLSGEATKETSIQLKNFLKYWQKVHIDSLRCKEPRKKTKRSKRDEFFAADSEEEEHLMSNVFVLCGPPGTGKTSMVYALTSNLSAKLLEVNTSVDRGFTTLKKRIEEATQSMSLDLSIYDQDDADEDDKKRKTPSTPMSIILLDEVDNVFDQHGDSGFWLSAKALAKRSKCPIVMTCTEIPKPLQNYKEKCEFGYTYRPSVSEAAYKICNVLHSKKVIANFSEVKTVCRLLSCDMRRILNEYQVLAAWQKHNPNADATTATFLFASPTKLTKSKSILECLSPAKPRTQKPKESKDLQGLQSASIDTSTDTPVMIYSLSPNSGPHAGGTTITISGAGFLYPNDLVINKNTQTRVTINGVRASNVVVHDDNTLTCTSPPTVNLPGVNESGVFEETYDSVVSTKFCEVVVMVTLGKTLVFSSDDHKTALSSASIFEYVWPEHPGGIGSLLDIRRKKKRAKSDLLRKRFGRKAVNSSDNNVNDNDDEDYNSSDMDDFEVDDIQDFCDDDDSNDEGTKKTPVKRRTIADEDEDEDEEEDNEDDNDHCGTSGSVNNIQRTPATPKPKIKFTVTNSFDGQKHKGELESLKKLAAQSDINSFVALFESQTKCNAIPRLAGDVPGFGDEINDDNLVDFPNRNSSSDDINKLKKTKTRPTSEKIFESSLSSYYGSPNTFVTNHNSRTDKRILSGAWMRRFDRYLSYGSSPTESNNFNNNSKNSSNLIEDDEEFDDAGNTVNYEDNPNLNLLDFSSEVNDEFLYDFSTAVLDDFLPTTMKEIASVGLGSDIDLLCGRISWNYHQTALKYVNSVTNLHFGGSKPCRCEQFAFGLTDHFDHNKKSNEDYMNNCNPINGDCILSLVRVLDNRFVLDYLPFLRAIAHQEKKNSDTFYAEAGVVESLGRGARRKNSFMHYFDKILLVRPEMGRERMGHKVGSLLLQ